MLDLIQAYENYLKKVKQASGNTVSSYLRDIRQFSEWLRIRENTAILYATQLNISDYLQHLQQQGKSGATISRTLASLKNFYSYVVSNGFLEESPVTTQIHVDRGEKKLPQILTGKEVELLLAQPGTSDAKGLRDKAMLEVMDATGIRVTELIDLNLEDVNLDLGIIKCGSARKSRAACPGRILPSGSMGIRRAAYSSAVISVTTQGTEAAQIPVSMAVAGRYPIRPYIVRKPSSWGTRMAPA